MTTATVEAPGATDDVDTNPNVLARSMPPSVGGMSSQSLLQSIRSFDKSSGLHPSTTATPVDKPKAAPRPLLGDIRAFSKARLKKTPKREDSGSGSGSGSGPKVPPKRGLTGMAAALKG